MKNPKLALIPSGYKSGKVYSILPTDGVGDFDFSRGSTATRVNKDGLIETVNNNVPRLDWLNSDCPSLLLEPQRTNYATNSENTYLMFEISGSESVTRTQNYSISPNGNLTASRLQASVTTGTNNYSLVGLSTTGSSGFYTASIYLKSNTSQNQKVSIYGRYSLTQNYTVTPEWQRFSFLGYSGGSQNSYIYLGILAQLTDSPAQIDVSLFGVQIEFGDYATSLITTISDPVTRQKDTAQLLNQTLFTDYPFTVYADVKIEMIDNFLFSLVDSGSAIKYLSVHLQAVNTISVLRRGVSASDTDSYSFNYSIGDEIKLAVSFINDTSYKFYINGTQIGNVTSGGSIPYDHNDICLGQLRIAADNGKRNTINEFRVYDYTLTDTELTELTTI